MMQTHRSAFVSKNSSYSLAFLAGKLNTKVQRSQSCSDTIQDRVRSRLRTAPPSRAKITTITPGSTPIIGVLLSTQNSRLLEVGQKLQQEEEGQQLALQSQRMFDSERRTMSRRKGSVDQYLLRSSSLAGAK
ncbi:rCG39478, isoform CRA_a [Rattus norvegicus]|uniref:RING-type E3 ubiquitin transferase n=1 Tax=Rattus norvegicus TaxID=10116 RepID=A6I6K9_RAT|nr:rCG39478, isoform CRA_a [Rattus norvegicus]